ncbi:MAG: helix-turn-helix domain-containing protein [Candidatus Delongbacteria bacterium]|nr:helix-turn-helix domain-containing protein [Candidatus Delongbacteria bacterium]
MLLFDDYDAVYDFLHENLPEKIKYQLLYTKVGYANFSKYPRHEKYGGQKPPYAVFLSLEKYGYAYRLESKETREKTIEWDKQVLLWSRIQEDIGINIFPSTSTEQFKLISINEACKFLGLTRPSVYKLINDNEIPVVQIFDKTKRIQVRDLLKYIESKKK